MIQESDFKARAGPERQGNGSCKWLRQAIGPLVVAARLERRDRMEDTAPIDALDDGAVAGAAVDARPGEQAWADFDLNLEQVETRATGSIEE